MSISKKIVDAINLEYLRDELARKGDLSNFYLTYKRNNPYIPNTNNMKKWDKLNFISKSDKNHNPMAWDRIRIIAKYVKKNNKFGNTILNIGFGAGSLENYIGNINLKKYHWRGIDFSEKSVVYAKNRFFGKYVKMDVTKMRFVKNTIDCIIMSEVLEHISTKDTFRVLNNIRRFLKNNGSLIISIPINEGLEEMLENNYNPNSHTRIYTEQIIKRELSISGFKITKIHRLHAFNKLYLVKKIISKYLPIYRDFNNLIIVCEK